MTKTSTSITSDIDLFSEEILRTPYPTFKILRDLGPAVYLTRKALASRVKRIELAGEPAREVNNITRGFSYLPFRVY